MPPASEVLRRIRSHADVLVFLATWTVALLVYRGRGTSPLFLWAAVALVLVGGWSIADRATPVWDKLKQKAPARLAAATPYLITSVVLLMVLGPVLISQPINQDHNHHYLNSQIQLDLIRSGHLFGWTDRVSTGLPFGDVYGTGVYLLTSSLSLVSAGLIPLSVSYTAGIVAAWLVPSLGVVAWSRRLGAGMTGAVVAALAFALDPGGDREGGWLYSFFHGVWPQFFATGVLLWALLALLRLTERPTSRRLATAVLLMGSCVWAHPMNVINLALITPLFVVVLALGSLRKGGEGKPLRALGWVIAAAVLSAVIGMGWFSHMLAGDDSVGDHAAYWQPLAELGTRMLWGQPFDNHVVMVGLLALAGMVALVRRAKLADTWVLAIIATFFVVGSMDVLASLDLGLSSKHQLFMYRRLSITIKPFWFAAAGVGATLLLQALEGVARPRDKSLRVTALVICAPLAAAAISALPNLVLSPAARPLTVRNAGIGADLAALSRVLADVRRQSGGGPLRVAYLRARGEQGEYALLPVAEQGFGYVPNHKPPCQSFMRINTVQSLEALRWLGASVAITHAAHEVDDAPLIGAYGPFKAYKLSDAPTHPASIQGAGSAQVLDWRPMYRRIRLEGVDASSKLVLGFPHYKKWKARLHGATLPVTAGAWSGVRHVASITGLTDGELELSYEDTPLEKGSLIACFVVLLAGLVGLVAPSRPLPWLIGDRSLPYLRALTLALIGLFGIAVVVVLADLRAKGIKRTWGEPELRVLSVLHQQRPSDFGYAPRHYCVRPFDRNPRPGCTDEVLEPMLIAGPQRGSTIPACLRVGVPDRGSAHVTFALPTGTEVVRGRIHKLDSRLRSIEATLGEEVHDIGTRKAFRLEAKGATTLELRLSETPSTAQICLELVALGR